MKITNLGMQDAGSQRLLSADIEWEDAARPDFAARIFLPESLAPERPGSLADALLIACLAPALAAGETRIHLEEAVCPSLPPALASVQHTLAQWFSGDAFARHPLRLEARLRTHTRPAAKSRQSEPFSCTFYSGGVDSTHLILANSDDFSSSHPGRIRHAVPVFGLDLGGKAAAVEADRTSHQQLLSDARAWMQDLDIQLSPVETNLRHMDDRSGFWGRWFAGPMLAALSTVLGERADAVYVASSGGLLTRTLDSTNPLIVLPLAPLDVNLRFPYTGVSRLQRLARITRSPAALQSLRVCVDARGGRHNCGLCEKCVRTRIALKLLGVSPEGVFPSALDEDSLCSGPLESDSSVCFYEEMREHASANGHAMLARLCKDKIAAWQSHKKWREGQTLGGRLRRALSVVSGKSP